MLVSRRGTASVRLSSLQSCLLLLHESGFDIGVKVTHVNEDTHESEEQLP